MIEVADKILREMDRSTIFHKIISMDEDGREYALYFISLKDSRILILYKKENDEKKIYRFEDGKEEIIGDKKEIEQALNIILKKILSEKLKKL